MASTFNAIDYSNELDAAGVPPKQAAAHVRALTSVLADVAFASNLVGLRQEIHQCEERLGSRIEQVRAELVAKIERVRIELTAKIETVSSDLKMLRTELTAKIDMLRSDLSTDIATLRCDIKSVNAELHVHRWIFGVSITLSTANLALTVKLLMP